MADQGEEKLQPYILQGLFNQAELIASRTWEPLREGVNISHIYQQGEAGSSAAFLHYIPGASVPQHVHRGFEHILILHGSQTDGAQVFHAGTLVIQPPGSHHQILSLDGCLALGIWQKPVKFL